MAANRLESARRGLIEILVSIREKWKKPMEMRLFVDGKRKPGDDTRTEKISGIELYYGLGESADHMIKQTIRAYQSPGELKIISSDKMVLDFAKRAKCQTQTSDDFAKWATELLTDKKPSVEKSENVRLSDGEVNYWYTMFKNRKS